MADRIAGGEVGRPEEGREAQLGRALEHGEEAHEKRDRNENGETAADGIDLVGLEQRHGGFLLLAGVVFVFFPDDLEFGLEFGHPLGGLGGGEREGHKDDLERERGEDDRDAPVIGEAVDPRHQREEDLAEIFKEAEVHDLVLVGLENPSLGEPRVFFRTDVKAGGEFHLGIGREGFHVELSGAGHAIGGGIVVGQRSEQFDAASHQAGGGFVGREDGGEELILDGGPSEQTRAGDGGLGVVGADPEKAAARFKFGA